MQISFPVYLTRIFSSTLCGALIAAISYVEYCFFNVILAYQQCVLADFITPCLVFCHAAVAHCEFNFISGVVIFSGLFFVGELFTGVSEILMFDKLFENIRFSNDRRGKLEQVSTEKPTFVNFLLLSYKEDERKIESPPDNRSISFRKIIAFMKNNPSAFSLSEMYFNIHRLLGGMYIYFWFVSFLIILTAVFYIISTCHHSFSHLENPLLIIISLVFNILLMYFSGYQAWKQRIFANNTVYYG